MSYLEEIERINMERADKLVKAASKICDLRARIAELEAINAELLAALKRIQELDYGECDFAPSIAAEAIAKAEGR